MLSPASGSGRHHWLPVRLIASPHSSPSTLQAQQEGEKSPRSPRFVKTRQGKRVLDEASIARARKLAGLKGYVSNIPADLMSATELIGSYHGLWQVEASYRMSKTDLRARPIFHHTHDAIEAHLTIVFAALAVAGYLHKTTGYSLKKVLRALRPLPEITVRIAGHDHITHDPLTPTAREILSTIDSTPD